MRRPLATAGFTMLFCGLFMVLFGKNVLWLLAVFAIACFAGTLFMRNKGFQLVKLSLQVCCAIALCMTVMLSVVYTATLRPQEALQNTQQTFTATVCSQDHVYDTSATYTVETQDLLPERGRKVKLHLQIPGNTLYQTGQILQATWELQPVSALGKARCYSEGIVLQAVPVEDTTITVVGQKETGAVYVEKLRNFVAGRIGRIPRPEVSAMVAGVCLGESNGLPSKVMTQFTQSGMSHIVAVSGLHTGMISGLLIGLFVMLRSSRRFVKLFSLIFVWLFVIMVGAPLSAVRAGIMYSFFAVGSLFFRQPDLLNTLGGAVVAILAGNPLAAGNLGFLTSVFACLGIILLATPLGGFLGRFLPFQMGSTRLGNALAQGVAVTLSATVGILPWSLLGFHEISFIAPLTNLLAVPLATVVLACGLLGAFLGAIPGFAVVGDLLLSISGWCAQGLMAIARFGSKIPGSSRPLASTVCVLAVLVALLAGVLMFRHWHKGKNWQKMGLALLLVLVVFVSTFCPVYASSEYEIIMIQSYGNTTVAICTKEGAVVIGCDATAETMAILSARGIREIQALILPRQERYGRGLSRMVEQLHPKQLLAPEEAFDNGLLRGIDPALNAKESSVLLGEVTVIPAEDYSGVAVLSHHQRFYYAHSRRPEEAYEWMLYAAGVHQKDAAVIIHENHGVPLTQTALLQGNGAKVRLFHPRWIFS